MRYIIAILLLFLSQMPLAVGYTKITLAIKDAVFGVDHERTGLVVCTLLVVMGLSAFTIGSFLLIKNFIE